MPGRYGRGRIRSAPKPPISPTGLVGQDGKAFTMPKLGKSKAVNIGKAVKSGGLSKPSRGTLNKAAEKMFSGKFR